MCDKGSSRWHNDPGGAIDARAQRFTFGSHAVLDDSAEIQGRRDMTRAFLKCTSKSVGGVTLYASVTKITQKTV